MDHGSAVEKLKCVREIETALLQDSLTLFLVPFEFHAGDLAYVVTICNHICSHKVLGAAGDRAGGLTPDRSNRIMRLEERELRRADLRAFGAIKGASSGGVGFAKPKEGECR